MSHHSLLFSIQVRNCLLVFSFHQLNGIFGLSDHPIVLIIEFLHPKDIVGASLLGKLQGLLDLLVCPFLEKKQLLLESFRFLL